MVDNQWTWAKVAYENFELATREKVNSQHCLLICNWHDSHIMTAWIAHCMKNNIIFMVLLPHFSHFTQPLDVGVFSPLKTSMASAIEPLTSTKSHHILKVEWSCCSKFFWYHWMECVEIHSSSAIVLVGPERANLILMSFLLLAGTAGGIVWDNSKLGSASFEDNTWKIVFLLV